MSRHIGKNRDYKSAASVAKEFADSSELAWRLTFREEEGLRIVACVDTGRVPSDSGVARGIRAAIALDEYGRPLAFGFESDGRPDGMVLPSFEARGASVAELMREVERRCEAAAHGPSGTLRRPAMRPLMFYLGSSLRVCDMDSWPWARTDGGVDRYGLVWTLRTPGGSSTFDVELAEGGLVMLSVGDDAAPRYEVLDMKRGVRRVEFFDDFDAAMSEAERLYDRATAPNSRVSQGLE